MSTWDDNDTEEQDDPFTCPVCKNHNCVPAYGNSQSDILIIGDEPDETDIKYGKPFTGANGKILMNELYLVGISMKNCRQVYLQQHPDQPLPKNKEYKETKKRISGQNALCKVHAKELVIKETQNRKAVLLVGADAVHYFTGKSITKTSGLQVTSPYIKAPLVFVCVSPQSVSSSTIGEIRNALTKFAKKLEELEPNE